MADDAKTPNEMALLRVLVDAHGMPAHDGTREPIMFLPFRNGLHHHALPEEIPYVDDAMVSELQAKGLIDLNYTGSNTILITPTPLGRSLVAAEDRARVDEPMADISGIVMALVDQKEASNPLAWPAVRPVLAALRDHWHAAGFSEHGIQLLPVARALPSDELAPLFGATIRSLVAAGYLEDSSLSATLSDDETGLRVRFPLEVALTERAHAILDGWAGAPASELVENLLIVLAQTAAAEEDPARKRRLEGLATAIRDLGISVTSDVIAKVITGGV